MVLTVSVGDDCERVKLKGIDTFIKAAAFLPDTQFVVIGIGGTALKMLQKISPQNVDFIPPISLEDLNSFYQKSKVYCQLSMREGLPNALCEAMLCECVPVGTDVQGITTAIGDTGFYVPYGDVKAAADAIMKALTSDKGKEARKRIIEMFPLSKRENILKQRIENMVMS
jgi:glycosyltransferase involved in cell wall biosynthesis